MARMRVFIVLALAIAAGGTFAFGTYRYMQNVPTQTVSVPTSGVVVAAADLQLGAELRREDLHLIQWPAGAVPAGAFTKPEDLVGRGLIQPVATNELFLPGKLAPKEAGAGLPPVCRRQHIGVDHHVSQTRVPTGRRGSTPRPPMVL